MKLLTLLTTFIITLASSNVFAKTFVCENWYQWVIKDGISVKNESEGTMFNGEIKEYETLTIRTFTKDKHALTYLGDGVVPFFYMVKHPYGKQSVSIYGYVITDIRDFDFQLVDYNFSSKYYANCNYQDE